MSQNPRPARSLGRMFASEMFPSGLPCTRGPRQVVASFLKIAEGVAHRWLETRKGVLLLQMAPYQPESGEIYIYDRLRDMWYLLSFESPLDGFSVDSFEKVYREYKLLAYVEQPGLLQNMVERRMESVSVPAAGWGTQVAPNDLAHDLLDGRAHRVGERRRSARGITHSIISFVGAAVIRRLLFVLSVHSTPRSPRHAPFR